MLDKNSRYGYIYPDLFICINDQPGRSGSFKYYKFTGIIWLIYTVYE